MIHFYSYFQIQDLICFCHQNFIILLNSHKPILIVHASALLYITPDYMKPPEMISMSLFRNWIKTGKKIEAKKMMKEWEKAGPELQSWYGFEVFIIWKLYRPQTLKSWLFTIHTAHSQKYTYFKLKSITMDKVVRAEVDF